MKDNNPIILIEAKWCGDDLDRYGSQLFRYFATTSSKFGILTNGIIYKFYTDLEEQNKMDEKPFMVFNLLDTKENLVPELKKFHKSSLDLDTIFNTASELKYSNMIKQLLARLLAEPSDTFINYILSEVYDGKRTKAAVDKFRDVIKKSYNQFLNETLNDRIKSVIENQSAKEPKVEEGEVPTEPTVEDKNRIITTIEELEAYAIVKSILFEIVNPDTVLYKDTESYFVIYYTNIRKWICRIKVGELKKALYFPDDTIRHNISNLNEIYSFKDVLIQAVKKYLS